MAFLLCACLIVGMGYAAVTDTLAIGGNATISQDSANEDFSAEIQFGEISNKTNITTAEIGADDNGEANDKITFTIVHTADGDVDFAVPGDTASFTFTVTNTGNSDALVKFDVTETAGFEITVAPATGVTGDNAAGYKVDATNGVSTFTLTIEITDVLEFTEGEFTTEFTIDLEVNAAVSTNA